MLTYNLDYTVTGSRLQAYATGTCLQGVVRCTYAQLIAALGAPHWQDNSDKTQVDWIFRCHDGTVWTVYDWKEPAPLQPDQEYTFHIGGKDPRALEAFDQYSGLSSNFAR